MGFFSAIKSIFDDEAMGDEIIKAQIKTMQTCKQYHPAFDMHQLLAETWLARMKSRGADLDDDNVQSAAYIETRLFSCLPFPNSARALGIWFIYKEFPNIISKYPRFGEEFVRLTQKSKMLLECNEFMEVYKSINPVTYSGFYSEDE